MAQRGSFEFARVILEGKTLVVSSGAITYDDETLLLADVVSVRYRDASTEIRLRNAAVLAGGLATGVVVVDKVCPVLVLVSNTGTMRIRLPIDKGNRAASQCAYSALAACLTTTVLPSIAGSVRQRIEGGQSVALAQTHVSRAGVQAGSKVYPWANLRSCIVAGGCVTLNFGKGIVQVGVGADDALVLGFLAAHFARMPFTMPDQIMVAIATGRKKGHKGFAVVMALLFAGLVVAVILMKVWANRVLGP
jgi:hypothetical protein